MTSNKIVFSLASLVVLLAFAFVVPCALAVDFKTEIIVEDVSSDAGIQLEPYIIFYVKFGKVVAWKDFDTVESEASDIFSDQDISIQISNEFGGVLDTLLPSVIVIQPREGNGRIDDGKNFEIRINVRSNTGVVNVGYEVIVHIAQGAVTAVNPTVPVEDSKNAAASKSFSLVNLDGQTVAPTLPYRYDVDTLYNGQIGWVNVQNPAVYDISLVDQVPHAGVTEPFKIIITLSEEAKELKPADIDVTGGSATEVVRLTPIAPENFWLATGDPNNRRFPPPTGRDFLYHRYLVTIAPKFENKNDIVIKVKAFEDKALPSRRNFGAPYKYTSPSSEAEYQEGFDKLTVKVGKENPAVLGAGYVVKLTPKRVIPAGGYLIVATDLGGTGINLPKNNDADNNTPLASERSPAEMLYNAIPVGFPNLEAFLGNGGTIDLVSPDAGLIISEIMWGSDASLAVNSNSQWIEIKNTTAANISDGR